MIFAGTSATYGHGRALVVATGMRTEMGRIAGMLRDVPDDTTPAALQFDSILLTSLALHSDRWGYYLGAVV